MVDDGSSGGNDSRRLLDVRGGVFCFNYTDLKKCHPDQRRSHGPFLGLGLTFLELGSFKLTQLDNVILVQQDLVIIM